MKKLIAIILSAVLLFTSIVSASMFTVSAEGEALTDNAVMPVYLDEFGNEVNVLHTNKNIPKTVSSNATVGVTKNVSNLPFSTLFTFTAGGTEKSHTYLDVEGAQGKGMILYVEMPKSADGNKVKFLTQFGITDGQSGQDGSRYQYGYQNWYYLAEGDTAWTGQTIDHYGIPLESGFKGYLYIPFKTITGGANDDPSTPDVDESHPQKVNNNGEPLYTDNITGEETTSPTDENGEPNAGVYIYGPSGNLYANTGIDNQDIVTGLIIQTGSDYLVSNGNMAEDDEIVVSAPVIVKGDVTDATTPDATKIIVGGKEQYFFATAVPYTGTAAHGKFKVPAGTKRDEIYGTLVMTKISGITPFVNTAYEITNLSTQSRTFQSNGPSGAANADPVLSYGIIFYVETTLENFEVNINSMVYDETGAAKYPATSYNSGDLFYLKEGDTTWRPTGGGTGSGASATYRRKLATTGGFKGYIYQPYGGSASTVTGLSACYYSYAGITLWPTTADGSWTDGEGKTAVVKISQPMVALEAITSSTPAVATVGGGALRDPFSGDVVEEESIYAPDELIGANEDLIDLAGNAMTLTTIVDATRDGKNNINAGTGTVTGTFGCYGANGYSGTFAENNTVFKDKLLRVTGSETATQSAVDMVQLYFTEFTAADHDGYMVYFENKSADTLYFAFQPYGRKAGGGTDYNQVNEASLPFLSQDNSGNWTWSNIARVASYTYSLAPGAKGFIYLSKQALRNSESYYFLKVRTSATADYPTTNVDFIMSAPILVDNYTQESAGMAYVNGADIPQDLMSGDFRVPNDYDGDLAVSIVDLVNAKEKASEAEFATFRANYLNTYFNDAEYNVLSAAFSVAPLAYNREDSSTILSDNPDRGYRSEMVLYFASEPLKISDTPDYTPQLLSGTGYTVDVSANAIYDSDIANGKREPETETDYNISNTPSNDRYPFGNGSGGAVHTVTVETLQAWINAHNNYIQDRLNAGDGAYRASYKLIQASEETLDNFYSRAAVHLVSNYMRYEVKNSAMFVGELTNVVYLNDEQKKQVVYTGAWSDRYFTIDGVERYIRVEGNAAAKNFFYYDNAGCRVYNDDGSLKELKIHVYHDPRTIFASDSTAEWDSRLRTYFVQYKIGYNDVDAKTYYTRKVTYADGTSETIEIANNLFNAYLTFTEFAHSDELPAGVLDALDYFFKYCASVGAKANFRPSYNTFTQNAYLSQNIIGYQQFRNNVASQCADEETMIAHIKQMAPVVAANKDAIHNISSGWIGFGGEMAAGFQYPPVSYKNVITALLDYHCIPNGLYFSSRSSSYVTNIINGVEAVEGYNSGNLDLLYGLEADAEWAEKYAKWCGFNNDAFFGEQNFTDWGSGDYYKVGNESYAYDTANAAYTPNDGELYTNGSHVPTSLVIRDGKYVWVGFNDLESGNVDKYNDTDNNIPTPMEAILELAHHRYTDFSQWHGFLDVSTPNVMTFWMDHNAQWIFEGDIDSVEGNNALFNAEERAAEITKPITKADLEANGILYDPAYFANTDSVNAYEFIRDHLGYRLVAQDVKVNYNEKKSDKINVSVNLKNYGFGAAFNMESTLAIFDSDGNIVQELKVGDPSKWYNLAPDYYTTKRNSSAQGDALIHSVSAGFDSLKDGTYYVGIKLANSAGTTARLANDVELNEQGYNILGHFNFARLSSEPVVKDTLKVMSYNIRALRGGEANADNDPLSSDEIYNTIANFHALLSRENPDVMIVCENRMYFDGPATSTDQGSMNVYDNLFKHFFPYAYNLTTGASAPRIYSKYPLSNIEYIVVDYADGSIGRRPLTASIEVGGEKIYIVACHPEAGAEVYETKRIPYFEAIAEFAADKENVIIAGDLNTDTADFAAELDIFADAGFTFGNFGEFGTFQTYRYGGSDKYLDNILVKGLEMKNFWVGTETYSDHFPIYSEISLNKEQ